MVVPPRRRSAGLQCLRLKNCTARSCFSAAAARRKRAEVYSPDSACESCEPLAEHTTGLRVFGGAETMFRPAMRRILQAEDLMQSRRATLDALHRRIRRCRACRLCESRTRAVPGEGPLSAPVMFVGEAPGAAEDAEGRPFVGRAGTFLDRMLSRLGLTRATVFVTNSVKCRP